MLIYLYLTLIINNFNYNEHIGKPKMSNITGNE